MFHDIQALDMSAPTTPAMRVVGSPKTAEITICTANPAISQHFFSPSFLYFLYFLCNYVQRTMYSVNQEQWPQVSCYFLYHVPYISCTNFPPAFPSHRPHANCNSYSSIYNSSYVLFFRNGDMVNSLSCEGKVSFPHR